MGFDQLGSQHLARMYGRLEYCQLGSMLRSCSRSPFAVSVTAGTGLIVGQDDLDFLMCETPLVCLFLRIRQGTEHDVVVFLR